MAEESDQKDIAVVKRDWPLILGLVTIGVTLLGLLPAYFIFWHRSDIVFDKRAVEIPLSAQLRKAIENALSGSGHFSDSVSVSKNSAPSSSLSQLPTTKLPDKLLYVNVRNVGKVPSSLIKVQITVPGIIADRDIKGAGSVLGDITGQRNSENSIYFECPNLADADSAKLAVALWYQQTAPGAPSVQVLETTEGPSREVGSVDTASFYLIDIPTQHWWGPLFLALPLGILTTLLLNPLIERAFLRLARLSLRMIRGASSHR